ncbi:molecular chaperone [Clostridium polyendosporum]|uniref:Molecular chaperone n=1 Tax=Clostridium polyendosporum TaxID=69208 RepID=A0A919RZH9_9CLOT|nr:polyphosphate polymerase domain-containing protein [Clostridium polyendosporum]GIM28360.1 molecular chaperone [Clostridium polyendosporum]
MSIKTFKRYEKKYLISIEQYNKLIPRLLKYMELDKHCKHNENYSIYNIYYDTENSDVISHSISHPYYKEKLRLRSYGIPDSPNDRVFLELKKKIDGIVSKRRAKLTLEEAYKFLEFGEKPVSDEYHNKQVLSEIEYYLRNNPVHPTVYIGYKRTALFGKENKDFRVTLDSKILTRRNILRLEEGYFGEDLLERDQYLMEVKIIGAMPIWFTKLLLELSIYSTHFSKYGTEYKRHFLKIQNNDIRREKIC